MTGPDARIGSPETPPSGDTSKTRSRLIIIAIMLAIGSGVFFWAWAILPSGQAINNLSSYDLNISEAGSPGGMSVVSLDLERQAGGAIKIQYHVATNFASTGSGSGQEVLIQTQLELFGPGMALIQCPPGRNLCHAGNGPDGQEIAITFAQPSGSAVVSDPALGFTADNETALAEMPYVSLESLPLNTTGPSGPSSPPNSMPLAVRFGFNIPDANTYDWSLPPLTKSPDGASWEDTVDPVTSNGQPGSAAKLTGAAAAAELTGFDHNAQSTDNQDIFVSGVLFGVAAAAGLTAVLEFLHLVFKIE